MISLFFSNISKWRIIYNSNIYVGLRLTKPLKQIPYFNSTTTWEMKKKFKLVI